MAGKGKGYGLDTPHEGYSDTVTIVVPRRAAEDLYYAMAMAMGGAPHREPSWAPGKGYGPRRGPKPGPKGWLSPKPKPAP